MTTPLHLTYFTTLSDYSTTLLHLRLLHDTTELVELKLGLPSLGLPAL